MTEEETCLLKSDRLIHALRCMTGTVTTGQHCDMQRPPPGKSCRPVVTLSTHPLKLMLAELRHLVYVLQPVLILQMRGVATCCGHPSLSQGLCPYSTHRVGIRQGWSHIWHLQISWACHHMFLPYNLLVLTHGYPALTAYVDSSSSDSIC